MFYDTVVPIVRMWHVVFLLQTCAHRWVNMASKNNWYMNGLCYLIPQDFNTNFITTLPILHDSSLQYIYTSPFWELHYGMGALGSSMQYTSQVVIIFVVCLFVCIRSVSRTYDRQLFCSSTYVSSVVRTIVSCFVRYSNQEFVWCFVQSFVLICVISIIFRRYIRVSLINKLFVISFVNSFSRPYDCQLICKYVV